MIIYLYGAFKNPDYLLLQSKFYKKRIEKKNTPQYVANSSVSLKLLLFASFFEAAFLYNQLQKLWEKLLFGQLHNVEKQWAKLESSYIMCLQHFIGERGNF